MKSYTIAEIKKRIKEINRIIYNPVNRNASGKLAWVKHREMATEKRELHQLLEELKIKEKKDETKKSSL